jgi:alkanesulfonate monooxygenase SsuD/methylene tetrahydromethanopterin reductase-like flavin-dependent oxidoreductase (luciferase family)
MELGMFQLLPAPAGAPDSDVIAQALWEVDRAEAASFDSVWLAEHQASSFGLIGAPPVYAAALAQRTRRLKLGFAVAVVPLHHPLRLAEEIAWVDALSGGRALLAMGPGFSPFEFAAFDVPLAERHRRLAEGAAIVRAALTQPSFEHVGEFWRIPLTTLRPRPAADWSGRVFRACASVEAVRQAAHSGDLPMLGLKDQATLASLLAEYQRARLAVGIAARDVASEIAEIRVLRRITVAPDREDALHDCRSALRWEEEISRRVHELGDGTVEGQLLAERAAAGGDGAQGIPGGCVGSPADVLGEMRALEGMGIRHVLAWLNFGNLPVAKVRRSLDLLCTQVLPALRGAIEASGDPVATDRVLLSTL